MTSDDGEPLFAFLPLERFVAEQMVGVSHLHDAQFSSNIVAARSITKCITPSER